MLINVKMPTIVGILTFIRMINTAYESSKARKLFNFWYFSFYELLKFKGLSIAHKKIVPDILFLKFGLFLAVS